MATKITKSELKQMIREALREQLNDKCILKEARSVAEIEAEIAKLQRELADAKIAEKRTALEGKMPSFVYAWDMYIDPADKGRWVSTDNEQVYETEKAAIDAGCLLLSELDDQDDLDEYNEGIEPDDFTVDVLKIPLSTVPAEILESSRLAHLIDSEATHVKCQCPKCDNTFYTSQANWDINKITCWICGKSLRHK